MSPIHCQDGWVHLVSFFVGNDEIKMVITISKETGSGGHTVGKMLAKRLGYEFYDKELISQTTEIILDAMKKIISRNLE